MMPTPLRAELSWLARDTRARLGGPGCARLSLLQLRPVARIGGCTSGSVPVKSAGRISAVQERPGSRERSFERNPRLCWGRRSSQSPGDLFGDLGPTGSRRNNGGTRTRDRGNLTPLSIGPSDQGSGTRTLASLASRNGIQATTVATDGDPPV
jgi:hypothetical protein